MRVKLLETFQGRDVSALLVDEGLKVSILEAGEVYEVDDMLGEYLLLHRKAQKVEKAAIVVVKPVPAPEPVEMPTEPKVEPEPRKRGRVR